MEKRMIDADDFVDYVLSYSITDEQRKFAEKLAGSVNKYLAVTKAEDTKSDKLYISEAQFKFAMRIAAYRLAEFMYYEDKNFSDNAALTEEAHKIADDIFKTIYSQ